MKARDVRELGQVGIEQRIRELERDYAALKEAVRIGKEKNFARLGLLRKDIARARTVLCELKQGTRALST